MPRHRNSITAISGGTPSRIGSIAMPIPRQITTPCGLAALSRGPCWLSSGACRSAKTRKEHARREAGRSSRGATIGQDYPANGRQWRNCGALGYVSLLQAPGRPEGRYLHLRVFSIQLRASRGLASRDHGWRQGAGVGAILHRKGPRDDSVAAPPHCRAAGKMIGGCCWASGIRQPSRQVGVRSARRSTGGAIGGEGRPMLPQTVRVAPDRTSRRRAEADFG